MHLALGLCKPTVAIFNCTSPWEIDEYGLLQKVISPRLGEYFYRRTHDPAATMAVGLDDVLGVVMSVLDRSAT
jgi:heptosyltransferase-2